MPIRLLQTSGGPVADQWSAMPASRVTPVPRGPRKAGQSSVTGAAAEAFAVGPSAATAGGLVANWSTS